MPLGFTCVCVLRICNAFIHFSRSRQNHPDPNHTQPETQKQTHRRPDSLGGGGGSARLHRLCDPVPLDPERQRPVSDSA